MEQTTESLKIQLADFESQLSIVENALQEDPNQAEISYSKS